jgi:hypothetical protein
MTKRAKESLDFYCSENAGVLSNIARVINHAGSPRSSASHFADSHSLHRLFLLPPLLLRREARYPQESS